MKTLIAFALLLVAVAVAQVPSAPQNLSVSAATANVIYLIPTMGTNNPLGLAHQGFAAYWQMPSAPVSGFGGSLSNVWVPEVSSDGTNWQPAGNHWAQLQPRPERTNWCLECWQFTETGSNDTNWQARIRRQ